MSTAVPNPPPAPDQGENRDQSVLCLPQSTRLHFNNVSHSAVPSLFKHIPDPYATLVDAFHTILIELYPCTTGRFPIFASFPDISSLTLIFDDSNGVAYTIGIGPGGKDKEIHFSLSYLTHCNRLPDPAHEIRGVITHELVHCYQYTKPPDSNIQGPPGGLIEGIADFVRLKASLAPTHWHRPTRASEAGEKWDAGYQITAYFLEWLDGFRLGDGAVAAVNQRLFTHGYTQGFWEGLCGVGVERLWEEYRIWLDMHVHEN